MVGKELINIVYTLPVNILNSIALEITIVIMYIKFRFNTVKLACQWI